MSDAPKEGRATHPAMTMQEEIDWADKLEADGGELTEAEVERIRVIRETAANQEAHEVAVEEGVKAEAARAEAEAAAAHEPDASAAAAARGDDPEVE